MEAALFLVAIIAVHGSPQATEEASKAFIKQNRIDERVEQYAKTLVSKPAQKRISQVAVVAKTVIDRKITLEWTFP